MIDLSQELIFSLILRAIFTGTALGLSYEAVRMCRMLIEGEGIRRIALTVFLFFTDLVFCLVGASAAILLTYNISGGVFRGCVYIGMALGLMLYRLTVGRLLKKFETVLAKFIKKTLKAVIRLILFPIKAIFSLVCKIYGLTIGRIIGKIKCNMILKQIEKQRKQEIENAAKEINISGIENKEEENNAYRSRYKKERRISFGGSRGD